MKRYLETERIYLRELKLDDIDLLLQLDSDPEVMKFLTAGKPSSRHTVQLMIERVLSELRRSQHRFGVWAAHELTTDEFIGWFHLFPPREEPADDKRLFLGYRLKKKHWGKGYATEVSAALVKKAFTELNATEVCAQAMKGNLKSQKVMLNVGLKLISEYKEKSFPIGAQDSVLFSLLKDTWERFCT